MKLYMTVYRNKALKIYTDKEKAYEEARKEERELGKGGGNPIVKVVEIDLNEIERDI